jgi:CRP-like cAMP-binding protein
VFQSPNRLLASLSAEVFAAIQPHLKLVQLTLGDVVAETGSTVTRVYFPHAGVISLVVEMESGQMVETAMVGRDGVFNAAAALDGKVSLNKALVQLAGSASMIDVDRLRLIADEHGSFRSILIRHEQVMFAQSQQSAACNATHLVEARIHAGVDQRFHVVGLRHVGAERHASSALLGDDAGGFLRRGEVDVDGENLRPLAAKRHGGGLAVPPARADRSRPGDDRNPVLQSCHKR